MAIFTRKTPRKIKQMPSANLNKVILSFRNFNGGLNTIDNTVLMSENQSPDMANMYLDETTGVTKRKGCELKSTLPSGKQARVMYNYKQIGGNDYIIATDCENIYHSTDGITWTLLLGNLDDNFVPQFETFENLLWITNGFNTVRTWDGTTILDKTFIPKGKLIKLHKSALWVASTDDDPSIVYFSDNLQDVTTSAAWSALNSIDVNSNDGERILAIYPFLNSLLVFKNKSIYVIRGDDYTNFTLSKVSSYGGSVYPNTIAIWNNYLIFAAEEAIYLLSGLTEMALRRISDKIKNLYGRFVAGFVRYKELSLSYYQDFEAGETQTNLATRILGGNVFGLPVAKSVALSGSGTAFTDLRLNNGKIEYDEIDDPTIYDIANKTDFTMAEHERNNGNDAVKYMNFQGVIYSDATNKNYILQNSRSGGGANSCYVTAKITNNSGVPATIHSINFSNTLFYGHATFGYMGMQIFTSKDNVNWHLIWANYAFRGNGDINAPFPATLVPDSSDNVLGIISADKTLYIKFLLLGANAMPFSYFSSRTEIQISTIMASVPGYDYYKTSGSWISEVQETGALTPHYYTLRREGSYDGVSTIKVYVASGSTSNFTPSWTLVESSVPTTDGTIDISGITKLRFYRIKMEYSGGNTQVTPGISLLKVNFANTGQFISDRYDVKTLISSFKKFYGGYSQPAGTSLAFYLRYATSEAGLTTASWVPMSDNKDLSSIPVSNRWIQFRVDLTGNYTITPTVDYLRIKWVEGGLSLLNPYAITYKDRYWLTISEGGTANQNNMMLVFDKQGAWVKFTGINAQSFVLLDGKLFSSDVNGKIFLQDTGNSDNGNPIRAYLTTKDFDAGALNNDKRFRLFFVSLQKLSELLEIAITYEIDYNRYRKIFLGMGISLGQGYYLGQVISNKSRTALFNYDNSEATYINKFINQKVNMRQQDTGKLIRFTVASNKVDENLDFIGLDLSAWIYPVRSA